MRSFTDAIRKFGACIVAAWAAAVLVFVGSAVAVAGPHVPNGVVSFLLGTLAVAAVVVGCFWIPILAAVSRLTTSPVLSPALTSFGLALLTPIPFFARFKPREMAWGWYVWHFKSWYVFSFAAAAAFCVAWILASRPRRQAPA